MEKYTDTIAAIATPIGQAALAIVRLSGNNTLPILQKIFRKGKGLSTFQHLEERKVHYGFIVDPETQELVDEVTLIFLQGTQKLHYRRYGGNHLPWWLCQSQ